MFFFKVNDKGASSFSGCSRIYQFSIEAKEGSRRIILQLAEHKIPDDADLYIMLMYFREPTWNLQIMRGGIGSFRTYRAWYSINDNYPEGPFNDINNTHVSCPLLCKLISFITALLAAFVGK